MPKQARKRREEFMNSSFKTAPADVLVAIILAPGEAVSWAQHIIRERLSKGKCSLVEIDSWINIFTDFATTKTKAIREFWNLLNSAGHKFNPEQLAKFACVFGKGNGGCYYDEAAAALFAHPKTAAEHILEVILRVPRKKEEAFRRLVKKNPSVMTLLACVGHGPVEELALRELMNRSDRPKDGEAAKKILLASLEENKASHSDFELLCKWDILSEAELLGMTRKLSTRRLAFAELNKRRRRLSA